MNDIWSDPTTQVWVDHVLADMVPKLESSVIVCSLLPDDREGDVKFWVELGASIMLDKPIVLVAFNDRPIPAKLAAVADEIVTCPQGVDPASSQELQDALTRLLPEPDEDD